MREPSSLEGTGGDRAGAELLDAYRALVREEVARHAGAEIRTEGDSFYLVFPPARRAVACGMALVAAAGAHSREHRGSQALFDGAWSTADSIPTERGEQMIVTTTPYLPGHRVTEAKGQVFGLVVRSRGFAGNLSAALRSLVGGEIHEYTELLEDTRRQALDRMVENATLMGANAVISMRFDSSEIGNTMSEIVAYGTAVVVVADASAGPSLD